MIQLIGPGYQRIDKSKLTDIEKITKFKIDMHLHSNASYDVLDKSLTPESIVFKTIEKGLTPILTDHDTFSGVEKVQEYEKKNNNRLGFIPGVEFTMIPKKIRAISNNEITDMHTIHIGVHNLNRGQYKNLQELANNGDLDEFVNYLSENHLPNVLNHIFWCEAGEKLKWKAVPVIVKNYFPVIELNGKRTNEQNVLTLQLAEELGVALVSASDNHTGESGTAYTMSYGSTYEEFWWDYVIKGQVYCVTNEITTSSFLLEAGKFIRDLFNAEPEYLRDKGFGLNTGVGIFQFILDELITGRLANKKLPKEILERLFLKLSRSRLGEKLAERIYITPQKNSIKQNNETVMNLCRELNLSFE
ncbi:MAG: PHP domain-containing protein [Acidobacteria bacterium]|nr:PHP domain-containing protein [Acidobacteriota bacterium]